jgi:hypothetical protein
MKLKILILIISFITFYGCGTLADKTKRTCLDEISEGMILRWGGHNYQTHYLSGFQIDGNAQLYKFTRINSNADYILEEISPVDTTKFCELLRTTKKLFIEIQSLNVQADSSQFVEYINPATNIHLSAVWNEMFKTFGSKEFRGLFDSLNGLVPEKYKAFEIEGD